MTWQRIERLFEGALEQPASVRQAWLARACREQASLYEEVATLLEAHELAEGFLEEPAWHAIRELRPPGASVWDVPRRIGAYRLRKEIGRGGMGIVYLAERADSAGRQEVALKVLRPGIGRKEETDGFLSERQILASLHHPAIATLCDGGMTDDGRPYLVMEYVDGQPIDSYCDARRLSVEERLRLFIQVAEAVHYAHQRGVVHRDLKPGNILVTQAGQVKLLDFGLAELMARGSRSAETLRRMNRQWMTLSYASPEQVRLSTFTTATDVYQLGGVLFELLTGERPQRVAGKTPSEIKRLICEEMPAAPSAVVVRQGPQTARRAVSAARGTHPGRLRRLLRGDLDAIMLKALRKEPAERYPSIQALVEDIERHLAGRRVRARHATAVDRIQRFVMRHRVGVLATTSLLVAAGLAVFYALRGRSRG